MPPRTRRNIKTNATAVTNKARAKPAEATRVKNILLGMCGKFTSENIDIEEDLRHQKEWLNGVVQTYRGRFCESTSPVTGKDNQFFSPVKERCLKRVRRSADDRVQNDNSKDVKTNDSGEGKEAECGETEIDVYALIVKDLRKELQSRNLPTCGLKKALQKRLLDALEKEKNERSQSNPSNIMKGTTTNMSKVRPSPFKKILEEDETLPQVSDVPVKQNDTTTQHQINEAQIEPMDISKDDDVEMKDSDNQGSSNNPIEIDNPGSSNNRIGNKSEIKIATGTHDDINGITIGDCNDKTRDTDTVSQLTMESYNENTSKMKKMGNMLKATAKYLSPAKAGKSAMKMIPTKSPRSATGNQNMNATKQLFTTNNVYEPGTLVDVTANNLATEMEHVKQNLRETQNLPIEINVKEPVPAPQCSQAMSAEVRFSKKTKHDATSTSHMQTGKSGVFKSGASIAAPPTISSSSSSKSKSTSKQLQEKKQRLMAARKARLEEMRGKSKNAMKLKNMKEQQKKAIPLVKNPLPSSLKEAAENLKPRAKTATMATKPAISLNSILSTKVAAIVDTNTTVTSVVQNNGIAPSATAMISSEEKKRQIRAAQIREKAAAEVKKRAAEIEVKSALNANLPKNNAHLHLKAAQENAKKHKVQLQVNQSATQQQKDTYSYEISDKEDSDSDSESEEYSEDENKPKKKYASWTKKDVLLAALDKQFGDWPGRVDPESIFTDIETCDLNAIFESKKARYQKRTSSGNWDLDRVTPHEKLIYRRKMGFPVNVK
mmetsp:Transcript_29872/g.36376  ORF Transcript_29872/g.36376 Transcript_29872/m.36376 type:complete len:774 (+) Transcript_29872:148-2469(+)|eukprot:CAMPEP_0172523654 /NCGR_PEP_ID=MMETSP1066-20121228/293767_1 /TAXON_ID=671091 /ORGANISM="Coscinodiscus wailesii, Strain CCMP2513" /LENGTH=773 /DNA_ID=CAMNT_0013306737 /DNA_START=45 /DNA_END=2366 /DNA_ORIENTATION=-